MEVEDVDVNFDLVALSVFCITMINYVEENGCV